MLGQTFLLSEKPSLQRQVETDRAALSPDFKSQGNIRLVWTGLGFAVLMLIGCSAYNVTIGPLAPHASAHAPHRDATFAFAPSLTSLVPRSSIPGRHPVSLRARPTAVLNPFPPLSRWAESINTRQVPVHLDDPFFRAVSDLKYVPIEAEADPEADPEADTDTRWTELMPGKVGLQSFAVVVPHPQKADRNYDMLPHCGGEDAFFIEDDAGVVGVADGVGGSSFLGDPGAYSRQLMNFAAEEARADESRSMQDDPVELLQRAQQRTSLGGTSTALILAFSKEQVREERVRDGRHHYWSGTTWKVKAANLGDSGFIQLRRGRVLFQSTPLLHEENHPFQVSRPAVPGGRLEMFGDSPTEALSFELQDVLKGDVFVLGTDGLFDNAFATEIADIVHREELAASSSLSFMESAADAVALWASQGVPEWAAEGVPNRPTPYAVAKRSLSSWRERAALSAPTTDWAGYRPGGKLDDITVVVVVVDDKDI